MFNFVQYNALGAAIRDSCSMRKRESAASVAAVTVGAASSSTAPAPPPPRQKVAATRATIRELFGVRWPRASACALVVLCVRGSTVAAHVGRSTHCQFVRDCSQYLQGAVVNESSETLEARGDADIVRRYLEAAFREVSTRQA